MRYSVEASLLRSDFFDLDGADVPSLLSSDVLLRGELAIGEWTDWAVGGREDDVLGGWGNWPMLTVFLMACGVGNPVLGLLAAVVSMLDAVDDRDRVFSLEGVCGRLGLPYLGFGIAGRGVFGGSATGLESTGNDISLQRVSQKGRVSSGGSPAEASTAVAIMQGPGFVNSPK